MTEEPDFPRGEFLQGPEIAPYPREWTANERVVAYWWALANRWTVEANPRADDEGASGWYRVAEAMNRDQRRQRPPELGGPAPEPPPDDEQPADPSEPRYPNPAEPQDNELVSASPMESW